MHNLFNEIDKFGDKIVVKTDDGVTIRYSDIISFEDKLKVNIDHRTLVFCLTKNDVSSILGYVSFIRNGIVPLMLDATIDVELLEKLISKYQPEYLWGATEIKVKLSYLEEVITLNGYSLLRLSKYSNVLDADLALLLTTSGSTGSPKLVRLSYRNIFSNAVSIATYLDITDSEKPITTLPMYYSYGLSVINSHLICGATILLTGRSLMEKEFWSFLKEEGATSLSGVPYTYEMLKRLRFFRMELPTLKTMTQAGGKLNINLIKEFSTFSTSNNKGFFVMYGQTEATARMSYVPIESLESKIGSIGIPIPGGEFNLIDEKGNNINVPNITGELVYRGDNVCMGYAECLEDLSKSDENSGVLYTGDLAYVDNDGFYTIVGRKRRFIKLFGNRIGLDETEQMLKNIISECACVGTDEKMIIYTTELGRDIEIKKYLSAKTGIHHAALEIRYCNEIPKNNSGKILYSKLDL